MRFAHIADCHLGGWRDIRLQEANTKAFKKAIQRCIAEEVDFVLICGDMFNTAIPPIEIVRTTAQELKRLKDAGIRTYIIAGSHDYSPSGKTMIDVLESAGLCINVSKGEATEEGKLKLKFTEDETGVKITGVLGKRGGLDKAFYEELDRESLKVEGNKIFMFHGTLNELKPADIQGEDMPVSLLPAGFNYYAGGHVHIVKHQSLDGYENLVYPGPTFPNNFAELENLRQGNMVIVDDWKIENIPIKINPTVTVKVNGTNKTPSQIETDLLHQLTTSKVEDAIVLIRVSGVMQNGKINDIPWDAIIQNTIKRGAYACLKNINALKTPEIEQVQIAMKSMEEIESQLIEDTIKQDSKIPDTKKFTKELLHALNTEKQEGETQMTFERRVQKDVEGLFDKII